MSRLKTPWPEKNELDPAACLSVPESFVTFPGTALDFGPLAPETLRTNLRHLTHFLRIKSAKSTVFTEVLTGLRIKWGGAYIPPRLHPNPNLNPNRPRLFGRPVRRQ